MLARMSLYSLDLDVASKNNLKIFKKNDDLPPI